MKRMTTRVYGKSSLVKGMSIFDIKEAVDRLAAYEDTGLEPEEIDLLAKQRDLYVDACGELPLQRIRELAQADREGRCVVLPRLEPGRGDPAGELGEPGPPGVPWSPGRHKTYNELIKWLRTASGSPCGVKMSNAAANALARLQAENVYMRKLLHRYCGCKVCANAADPYGLHCKFGGCNGGGNGAVEEDRWQLRPQT